jgi:hypothetical protein
VIEPREGRSRKEEMPVRERNESGKAGYLLLWLLGVPLPLLLLAYLIFN